MEWEHCDAIAWYLVSMPRRSINAYTLPPALEAALRLRRPWLWAVTGFLLGGLCTAAVYAPAQWLANGIHSATQGQVKLRQARGTVWSGSAQLVLTGGRASQDSAALPGRMHWTIRPRWSQLHIEASSACCMPEAPLRATIEPGWNHWRINVADGRTQWPAKVLAGLGTPWNTIQPSGNLTLSSQSLAVTWAAGRISANGQLQLQATNIASRLSTLRPMGSYQLILQGGNAPTLTLSTLSGDLQLRGSGLWANGRLRFEGEATATPEREAALANLLNIIGRRQGARSIITAG